MIFENVVPFAPCEFRIKFAASRWEREGSYALRRAVFCEEQPIFNGDDRDATDDYAIPIVALSMLGVASDRVVGVVRIHEDAPGIWWGSRLAVERAVSAEDPVLHKRWIAVVAATPTALRAVLGGCILLLNGVLAEFFGSRLSLPADALVPRMLAAAASGVIKTAGH